MINIPDGDEFLTDLILQRTRPFIALCGKSALAEWTRTGNRSPLAAALRLNDAVDNYLSAAISEIAVDVSDYVDAIGDRPARRLVSIGCGNGIAEVMLCRALSCEYVLLVDIETGGHGHGYGATAAGYGNLSRAASLMRHNGLTCDVATWNPAREPEPVFQFDVLVSMYAMGFHFPANSYDGFIERNRAHGALVIHDSRQGRICR